MNIGFKPSKYDECLYYRGNVIFLVYVDGGIFISPSSSNIDKAIEDLKKQKLDIADQGDLKDYLGVNITKLKDGSIKLTQPHITDQIIEQTKLNPKAEPKQTPALSSKILTPDYEGKQFDERFDYRSIIGKLNFLEKSTCPDIAYAGHQCARFSSNPKQSHGKAVEHIASYLKGTRDHGIIIKPDTVKSMEVFADADFSGNWNRIDAEFDPNTAKSRTGYLITFCDCPIIWTSKIQTTIALSSTKTEYAALSQSMREAVPLMSLIAEMKSKGFNVVSKAPRVHCKAFEDNHNAIELAKLPKLRPRTKHINITYHHFRQYVSNGTVKIFPICTTEQCADILTKPLPQNSFLKLRKYICGF